MRNHIFASILSFVYLQKMQIAQEFTNIYQHQSELFKETVGAYIASFVEGKDYLLPISRSHQCVSPNCIKVDDSTPGITEGINAGMWTVGLTLTGNEAGFTLEEFMTASDGEKSERRRVAEDKLKSAGAHYTIDSIVKLPVVIQDIERRLIEGDKP